MAKKTNLRRRIGRRGQSFAELMLVLGFLIILLVGVVEFGFLLNSYLHVFDAAREAARFSSSSLAIAPGGLSIEEFYTNTAVQAMRVMTPLVLRGNNGDDVVISVFSASGTHVDRYPSAAGWSLCNLYGIDWALIEPNLPVEILPGQFLDDWQFCTPQTSTFPDSAIEAMLEPLAPPSGVLLVEIFYFQDQVLGIPPVSVMIPDPIRIYVYSVMPLSSAEPTATPRP